MIITHEVEEPAPCAGDVVTVGDAVMVGKAAVLVVDVTVVGLGGDTVVMTVLLYLFRERLLVCLVQFPANSDLLIDYLRSPCKGLSLPVPP